MRPTESRRAVMMEAELREIARQAKDAVSKMGARSVIVEAAMRVIMKHNLTDEFSRELNHPPAATGGTYDY